MALGAKRSRIIIEAVIDLLPGIDQRDEPVFVQALIAELAVVAVHICVFDLLARLDEVPLYPVFVGPRLVNSGPLSLWICAAPVSAVSSTRVST
jgi:hypothetical protein